MNIRRSIALCATALTCAVAPALTAPQQPAAAHDAVVDFGAPQPQVPPVNTVTPEEVTITKGGTVTWLVNGGGHGIGIYKVSKDTTRDDIIQGLCHAPSACDAAAANLEYIITDGKGNVVIDSGTNPPMLRLNDADHVMLGAGGPAFLTGTTPTNPNGNTVQYRFTKTGRYLVICMNRVHAIINWMFGFVTVVGDDN
jgi:plastocyanin